jgi:hypothetical protein
MYLHKRQIFKLPHKMQTLGTFKIKKSILNFFITIDASKMKIW